jgi:hypothetical protein
MLDYYDAENTDQELVVTFENCRFYENRYFGYGSQTALIVGNSQQNRLIIEGTVFENNDMTWNNTSPKSTTHLIESLGPTVIEQSCFITNPVVESTVVVYGNEFRSSRIYSSSSGGQQCAFASVYENYQQFQSRRPLCVAATKTSCDLDLLPEALVDENTTVVNQYVPFAIGALDYDFAKDSDQLFEGGCSKEPNLNINGADAQDNVDDVCKEYGGCFISHTVKGEQVWYRFGHYNASENADGLVYVDITVRMSSAQPKLVQIDLLYEEDDDIADSWIFETGNGGYSEYEEFTWENVPLRGYEPIHTLVVTFLDGMVNFCMIRASYSVNPFGSQSESTLLPTNATDSFQLVPSESSSANTTSPITSPTSNSPSATPNMETGFPTAVSGLLDAENGTLITVPGTYSAMYFTNESSLDGTNGSAGDCSSRPDSFVDAWITSDLECGEAVNEYGTPCYIEWTTPGKWIEYDFSKDSAQEQLSVSIRISSPTTEPLEIFLYSDSSDMPLETFWGLSPGLGDGAIQFSTFLIWEKINVGNDSNYRLRVVFPNGGVKLCSIGFL